MDITRFLSFGDRDFANQYFVTLTPLGIAICAAFLILPPWIGGWYAKQRGRRLATIAQCILLVGLFGCASQQNSSDEEELLTELESRILIRQLLIAGASSVAAGLWLRARN